MSSVVATVHLRPGHVQPIWAGHPWVYAQAIARIDMGPGAASAAGEETGLGHGDRREPAPGDLVRVVDPHGNVLGRGFWSQRRAIPIRLVARDESTSLDEPAWLIERLRRAIERRRTFGLPDATPGHETTGYRLLHAEGDDVPGLVVDLFGADEHGQGAVVVVQVGTAGLRRRAGLLVEALRETLRPRAILDRTSAAIAETEGFTLDRQVEFVDPADPVTHLRFKERGVSFEIPSELGQKTGFYFDQRPLRARVEALARGRRVLDAFCYVGAIALAAVRGGASKVVAIDDSLRAIDAGAACARANGVDSGESGGIELVRADVRRELPKRAAAGERYDLVVLDPPKLAPTRGDRDAAIHYQTKLVEAAAPLVSPGGLLVTCSCSTALGGAELARALAIGARRAGRSATILERLGQGADHPVPAAFPEGVYLSTLIAELGAPST